MGHIIDKRQLLGEQFDCDKIAEDILAKLEAMKHSLSKDACHTLEGYQKTIKTIGIALPFLENELAELTQRGALLQDNATKTIAEIDNLKNKLLPLLRRLADSDLDFAKLAQKQEQLMASRQACINVRQQAENLLNNRENLYLVQMLSNSLVELGGGLDEVVYINVPKAEEQIFSIETKMDALDAKIELWRQQRTSLNTIMENTYGGILQKIPALKVTLATLQRNTATLGQAIAQRELLHEISTEDTLYGAAVRGDELKLGIFLYAQCSLNKADVHQHKPIYYAFRCGHTAIATALMDYTELSQQEIADILADLPQHNKTQYSMLIALLENKNTFDHLWNERDSVGKNIRTIFKDYFSPEEFSNFSFLSNEVKRAISLNWQRKHTRLAEDIFAYFNVLEEDMLANGAIALLFINSKLKAYLSNHPDELLDPFARRLLYVKNKLEAAKVCLEFKVLAHGNVGFFGSAMADKLELPRESLEMSPL